jgi:TM2 domain-containing membrane protein YozV
MLELKKRGVQSITVHKLQNKKGMSLKFKIAFYNLMIFLIIFDIIYLIVWIMSIEMNLVKGLIVALSAALIMPWARSSHYTAGRKVTIQSLLYIVYKVILDKRKSNNPI